MVNNQIYLGELWTWSAKRIMQRAQILKRHFFFAVVIKTGLKKGSSFPWSFNKSIASVFGNLDSTAMHSYKTGNMLARQFWQSRTAQIQDKALDKNELWKVHQLKNRLFSEHSKRFSTVSFSKAKYSGIGSIVRKEKWDGYPRGTSYELKHNETSEPQCMLYMNNLSDFKSSFLNFRLPCKLFLYHLSARFAFNSFAMV